MGSAIGWHSSLYDPQLDPTRLLEMGAEREAAGDLHFAATAYEVALGREPGNPAAEAALGRVLDRLEIVEHGLRFRYVPGGRYLMGSETGDPDEQPVHAVELPPFWLTDTPVTWTDYCRLMDWTPPPGGIPESRRPSGEGFDPIVFGIRLSRQMRLQYCETEAQKAIDWHAHDPESIWMQRGEQKTAQELFGEPPRRNPRAPWTWDQKPMIAAGWEDARELAARLAAPAVEYGLPTEAEWEKAARGGLAGRRYSWGDEPPTPERCDFDRWSEFSIRVPRELPPNRYGLYGMCGGVWEWTADWYDAAYYRESPGWRPAGPEQGEERVLRGGSWADSAEAVTVSFRMSRAPSGWRDRDAISHFTPNFGFRLARRDPALSAL